MNGALSIQIEGELLRLLPEGALHWPAERFLAVADFHLGKSGTFGMSGLPLPGQAQRDDLSRLLEVLQREEIENLTFLGDLVHTRRGLNEEVAAHFIDSLAEFKGTVSLLVGNHDRELLRRWPRSWSRIDVLQNWKRGPFLFQHEPPRTRPSYRSGPYYWTGHIHPVVVLTSGADRLRLKTFVVGEYGGTVPAFSSLAGGHEVPVLPDLRFFPIADGQVFDLSPR